MTYKVALLLSRAGGMTPTAFSGAWQAAAPMAAPGLVSRCFNEPTAIAARIENAPPAAFDGVEELEFETAAQANAHLGSDQFLRQWLGPRRALLGAEVLIISGETTRVFDNPDARRNESGVKVLTLPVRRPGMTVAAFKHHWLVVHSGLARSGPNAAKHLVTAESTPADHLAFTGLITAPFDGIGVIRFTSPGALAAEFASDHYRNVMAPDEPRFTDPATSRAMPVRETMWSAG